MRLNSMQTSAMPELDRAVPEHEVEDLVIAAQQGDQRAFQRLYQCHHQRIYALCLRMVGRDADLAMTLVQDAFVRAWDKLSQFQGKAKFSTWLHRLTVNVILSDIRARKRRFEAEQKLGELDGDNSHPDSSQSAQLRDVERAIAQLPERARHILVLVDVEGYKHKEVAGMLDIAVGTSKAQLSRAREMLRDVLS